MKSIIYRRIFCLTFFLSYRIQEDHSIMSFSVSDDGRHALLNIASQVTNLIVCT